jgi:indolepyruvate ferredoxin oxidoreductase alpha subunit
MNGMDAIINGLQDSDVKIVTGVPGFPITVLMENIKLKREWSVNEKVALDIALGSSVCGERSAVIIKHVGMNILADPLVSSTTHTIGAGVVIFTGDDPGIQKSQNEMDSRFYGLIAEVPVFDPASPQAAYESVMEAYALSENASAPVIIRITDRLLKIDGTVSRKNPSISKAVFNRDLWHITMLGKHQRFHQVSYPKIYEYAEKSQLNECMERGKTGIISSGYPSSLVESGIRDRSIDKNISHLLLCITNPLPIDLVNRFIERHERILVIEETEPVIERQLSKKVLGKLTGHMPYGIIEIKDIEKALECINKDSIFRNITPETIEKRGARPLCIDCPYLPMYQAIKELGVRVAGDVGCSILTSAPPLSLLDAAYSLGSAISTACGFTRKGIALIGDFGLAHSGICGLINAVHNRHDVVVIILQNEIAAMTGGQEVPDLSGLLSSYVEDNVIVDPRDDSIKSLIEEKIKGSGVSVIIARAKCPRY